MVSLITLDSIPAETKALIGTDAARIYCAVLTVLKDRNASSSVISHDRVMRTARCGVQVIEAAQTKIHSNGLLDIELADWNLVNPQQSRFRYSLPESSRNNN